MGIQSIIERSDRLSNFEFLPQFLRIYFEFDFSFKNRLNIVNTLSFIIQ